MAADISTGQLIFQQNFGSFLLCNFIASFVDW